MWALGDSHHLRADEFEHPCHDGLEQRGHLRATDLEHAAVDTSRLEIIDGRDVHIERGRRRIVPKGNLGEFEVLHHLLPIRKSDGAIMLAHATCEQLFELAIDEGRTAVISCTRRTFHDAQMGINLPDFIRYQIHRSATGVTNDDAVVDVYLRIGAVDILQREYRRAFWFGEEFQAVLVPETCTDRCFFCLFLRGIGPDGWDCQDEIYLCHLHYFIVEAPVEGRHYVLVEAFKVVVGDVHGGQAPREGENIIFGLERELEPFDLLPSASCVPAAVYMWLDGEG